MRASVNVLRELKTASEEEERTGKEEKVGGRKFIPKIMERKRRSSVAVDGSALAENWNVFSAISWPRGFIFVGDLVKDGGNGTAG